LQCDEGARNAGFGTLTLALARGNWYLVRMICAGIDAGSRATKVVLFDSEQSRIVGSELADQGVEQQRLAAELF